MKPYARVSGVVALMCVACLAGATMTTASAATGSAATGSVKVSALPARYASQHLTWKQCLSDDDPLIKAAPQAKALECATLLAPMDWTDPARGASIKIAVSRLKATGVAKGVTFTNPGGPGGSGLLTPLIFLSQKRTALLTQQDVYGMDIRGTGGSTNLTCGNTSPSTTTDYRDRSARHIRLMLDTASVFARSCAANNRAFLATVTTHNTVRDLDLLRQVLHVIKINYIGYSGGTWLGAYYAQTFPQRVGHFVLDSNAEFSADWRQIFEVNIAMGTWRRFTADFTPWAAKYDSRYHLGNTATKVRKSYERLRALLQASPIDMGAYTLNGPALDGTVIGSLYKKAAFPSLAEVMSSTMAELSAAGTSVSARRAAVRNSGLARAVQAVPKGTYPGAAADYEPATFAAITCQDTAWRGTTGQLVAQAARLGRAYPLSGWRAIYLADCLDWQRVPAAQTSLPVITGKGVPPVLMVQSEHDPATPLEGAVRAAKHLAGARLFVVRREGDHGVYAGGNECVDSAVEAFVNTGSIPTMTCQGTGLPTPDSVPAGPATADGTRLPANPLERLQVITQISHTN